MSSERVVSVVNDFAHAMSTTCLHKPGLAGALQAVCQWSVMLPKSSQPQCMISSVSHVDHCQLIMYLDQQLPALQIRNHYIHSFYILVFPKSCTKQIT